MLFFASLFSKSSQLSHICMSLILWYLSRCVGIQYESTQNASLRGFRLSSGVQNTLPVPVVVQSGGLSRSPCLLFMFPFLLSKFHVVLLQSCLSESCSTLFAGLSAFFSVVSRVDLFRNRVRCTHMLLPPSTDYCLCKGCSTSSTAPWLMSPLIWSICSAVRTPCNIVRPH